MKNTACASVPVIVQIVSQDAQQRVCKLHQGGIVVLDVPQVVEQGLGGELHLCGSSRHGIGASSVASTQEQGSCYTGWLEKLFISLIWGFFFCCSNGFFPRGWPLSQLLENLVSFWPAV